MEDYDCGACIRHIQHIKKLQTELDRVKEELRIARAQNESNGKIIAEMKIVKADEETEVFIFDNSELRSNEIPAEDEQEQSDEELLVDSGIKMEMEEYSISNVHIKMESPLDEDFGDESCEEDLTDEAKMVEADPTESPCYAPRTYRCKTCTTYFETGQDFKEHMSYFAMKRFLEDPEWPRDEGQDFFHCHETDCEMVFTSSAQIRQHMQAHSKEPHWCSVCSKRFEQHDLTACQHEEVCIAASVYKCKEPGCPRQYTLKNSLFIHMRYGHQLYKKHVCKEPGCGKTFSRPNNLVRHMRNVHSSKRKRRTVRCSICHRMFENAIERNVHMKSHEGEASFVCGIENCVQTFLDVNALELHRKTHPGKRFVCQEEGCTEEFLKKMALIRHIRSDHRGLPFTPLMCDVADCQKTFTDAHSVKKHMAAHTGTAERTFVCKEPGCTKGYFSMGNLIAHFNTVHLRRRPFKCDVPDCQMTFSSSSHLNKHKLRHSSKRDFLCTVCGKDFKLRYSLQNHLLTHTDERRYECKQPDCGKSFVTSGALRVHEKAHSDERPFPCTFDGCKSAFKTSAGMKRHLISHTGEKKYVCTFEGCGMAFGHSSVRKLHMKAVHLDERPFECDFNGCAKAFPDAYRLRVHLKTHQK